MQLWWAPPELPAGHSVPGILDYFAFCAGVWSGFVRAALLPAVGTCVVLSFGVMSGCVAFSV